MQRRPREAQDDEGGGGKPEQKQPDRNAARGSLLRYEISEQSERRKSDLARRRRVEAEQQENRR
jgi:hypothetical protein